MLAQNFKTPADLKITDAEFDALLKVLGMLERGELVDCVSRYPESHNGFNMSTVGRKTDCGTVGCIMGWAQYIGGESLFDLADCKKYPDQIWDLFMFGNPARHAVTAAQAALALRNYLTHGAARWTEALQA